MVNKQGKNLVLTHSQVLGIISYGPANQQALVGAGVRPTFLVTKKTLCDPISSIIVYTYCDYVFTRHKPIDAGKISSSFVLTKKALLSWLVSEKTIHLISLRMKLH